MTVRDEIIYRLDALLASEAVKGCCGRVAKELETIEQGTDIEFRQARDKLLSALDSTSIAVVKGKIRAALKILVPFSERQTQSESNDR